MTQDKKAELKRILTSGRRGGKNFILSSITPQIKPIPKWKQWWNKLKRMFKRKTPLLKYAQRISETLEKGGWEKINSKHNPLDDINDKLFKKELDEYIDEMYSKPRFTWDHSPPETQTSTQDILKLQEQIEEIIKTDKNGVMQYKIDQLVALRNAIGEVKDRKSSNRIHKKQNIQEELEAPPPSMNRDLPLPNSDRDLTNINALHSALNKHHADAHNKVQQLPNVDPRVETGVVQFGNDWQGYFIRGDNALMLKFELEDLLKGKTHPLMYGMSRSIAEDIENVAQSDLDKERRIKNLEENPIHTTVTLALRYLNEEDRHYFVLEMIDRIGLDYLGSIKNYLDRSIKRREDECPGIF